jgi:putative endonuclease
VNAGERRVARHYRVRGYRILGTNVHVGGYELDLIVRRGRVLVFVEVKERAGNAYGGPVAAVGTEKRRRVRRAARAWLHANHVRGELEIRLEVAAVMAGKVTRLSFPPEDEPRPRNWS